MSLEHILSTPPLQDDDTNHGGVFWLHRQRPLQRIPWYLHHYWMALFASVGVVIVYTRGHFLLHSLWNACSALVNLLVNVPLEEYYRNAPTVMGGWEGQSLPSICAQITFHGDEIFWRRNLEECERIFFYKQQSFMRIAKPSVYIVILTVSFHVVRMLVREYALHRRPRENREMVETYHALQVILRQFKRHGSQEK